MSKIIVITNGNELPDGWLAMFSCADQEVAEKIAMSYKHRECYFLKQSRGGHLYIVEEKQTNPLTRGAERTER
jgi:hypothetical protein